MIRRVLRIASLLFSTIVIITLFAYQTNSHTLKKIFFKKNYSQKKSETQLEYFKKIGKTDLQIKYDRYTTIGVNVLEAAPFIVAIASRNAIMYLTYAGAITVLTPITFFIKKNFKKPRPDDCNDLTSFPSGHSAFAFMVATVLLFCLKKQKNKLLFGNLSILIALLIAIGRVLAKRHWFSDVMFGCLFGCLSGIIAYFFVKKINVLSGLFLTKKNSIFKKKF